MTFMNHSSQVSEIKDKTSNLEVTLMSVYLLRLDHESPEISSQD